MNWHGIPKKINGGSITSMTKRGIVIPFPSSVQPSAEIVQLGGRQYRLRPGSWAEWAWNLVTVVVDEE